MAGIAARIFAGKKMITCAGPLKAAKVDAQEPVVEKEIINEVAKVEEPVVEAKVEDTPVETPEAPVETAQPTSKKKKK